MTGENWVLSEIAFDAKGVALDALHRVMEKATYPGIEIAPLSQS